MDRKNFQVAITLKDATLDIVRELIVILTEEVDLDVEAFDIQAFQEDADGNWQGISLEKSNES